MYNSELALGLVCMCSARWQGTRLTNLNFNATWGVAEQNWAQYCLSADLLKATAAADQAFLLMQNNGVGPCSAGVQGNGAPHSSVDGLKALKVQLQADLQAKAQLKKAVLELEERHTGELTPLSARRSTWQTWMQMQEHALLQRMT